MKFILALMMVGSVGATMAPTSSPTSAPTGTPTLSPTAVPTSSPTAAPSLAPSFAPSQAPSFSPSISPSFAPTFAPYGYNLGTCTKLTLTGSLLDGSYEKILNLENLMQLWTLDNSADPSKTVTIIYYNLSGSSSSSSSTTPTGPHNRDLTGYEQDALDTANAHVLELQGRGLAAPPTDVNKELCIWMIYPGQAPVSSTSTTDSFPSSFNTTSSSTVSNHYTSSTHSSSTYTGSFLPNLSAYPNYYSFSCQTSPEDITEDWYLRENAHDDAVVDLGITFSCEN